jgi:hypothetical protein
MNVSQQVRVVGYVLLTQDDSDFSMHSEFALSQTVAHVRCSNQVTRRSYLSIGKQLMH